MAERVVIAQISIDERGAVSALQNTTQQTRQLEAQTRTTADVFTSRMFSMRSAAQALLGSFTVAGGIYALQGLVREAIRADDRFLSLRVSAENVKTALGQALVSILGMNQALPETANKLNSFAGFLHQANQLSASLREKGYLERVKPGESSAELYGPPAPAGIGMFGYDPDASSKAAKALAEQKQLVIENAVAMTEYEFAAVNSARSVGQLNRIVEENGILLRGTAEAFSDNALAIEEITINQVEAVDAIARISFSLHELGLVADASGQLLGAFAAGGTKNIQRMMAQILGFVAALAWSRVATYAAAAVASSTGVGAAIEGGTPAQFVAAAALWKKVALVSTFGAAFLGAASSGGGGGDRGGFSSAGAGAGPAVPGRSAQQITINIDNFIGDDAYVRRLTEEIRKATSDGVPVT
jgi:hypothetical protein